LKFDKIGYYDYCGPSADHQMVKIINNWIINPIRANWNQVKENTFAPSWPDDVNPKTGRKLSPSQIVQVKKKNYFLLILFQKTQELKEKIHKEKMEKKKQEKNEEKPAGIFFFKNRFE
jgi:hypothetical protein